MPDLPQRLKSLVDEGILDLYFTESEEFAFKLTDAGREEANRILRKLGLIPFDTSRENRRETSNE